MLGVDMVMLFFRQDTVCTFDNHGEPIERGFTTDEQVTFQQILYMMQAWPHRMVFMPDAELLGWEPSGHYASNLLWVCEQCWAIGIPVVVMKPAQFELTVDKARGMYWSSQYGGDKLWADLVTDASRRVLLRGAASPRSRLDSAENSWVPGLPGTPCEQLPGHSGRGGASGQ